MADSKKYDGSQWEHSLRKLTTATEAVENPLYSDGTAITTYTLKGNTVQNGTPTPSNPVDVNGVGVRTENLFDVNNIIDGGDFYISVATGGASAKMSSSVNTDILLIPCQLNTTYTVSRRVITKRFGIGFLPSAEIYDNMPIPSFAYNDAATELTATSVNDSQYLCIYYAKHAGSDSDTEEVIQACLDTLMVNEGGAALPYEPYGYKIPISSGQQTIDIYIGDLPLLKSLDGTAVDEISNGTLTRRVDSDGSVLPTPTTTQITMPSIPTTQGANSISVDTTVQPSEFTATWTGWHDASVQEWDGSQWNE